MLTAVLAIAVSATPLGFEPSPRFPRGVEPMQLGPAPAGLADWSSRRCATCHREHAESWSHSGHSTARVNLVFTAALRFDDPTWCVQCHAPQASKADRSVPAADAPAEEHGVGCAACHAGRGAVLSSKPSPKSPHAIEVTPALRNGELCATCHQFGFSVRDSHGALARLSSVQPQQDTVSEWREWSRHSGDARGCVDCHMAKADHAFGGVRRFEQLKAAVVVEENAGALSVSTREMGHPFPTGDIMRTLTLEVATEPLFEKPTVAARWGRTLGMQRWSDDDTYLAVTADHRLSQLPEIVSLPSGSRWVAWRLVLHLVSPEQEQKGLLPSQVSRVVINAGMLKENP